MWVPERTPANSDETARGITKALHSLARGRKSMPTILESIAFMQNLEESCEKSLLRVLESDSSDYSGGF